MIKLIILIFFCLFNISNTSFVYPKVRRDENLVETKFGVEVSKINYLR